MVDLFVTASGVLIDLTFFKAQLCAQTKGDGYV